jgi:thiol-disulfide isomerase/thioredoxin
MAGTRSPRDRAPRSRPRGRAAAALAGAAALCAVALTGCSSSGPSSGGSGSGFVSGTGEISTVKAGHRPLAPELSGSTVDGKHLDLADYRGHVVVVNVWGSWCSPCRSEARGLEVVAKATAKDGVRFVGINTRDLRRPQAQRFEKSFGITYPSLYDPAGELLLRFPKGVLNPDAIPSTLILDRQGRIAVRALKPLAPGELRDAIDPIVAEKDSGSTAKASASKASPAEATTAKANPAEATGASGASTHAAGAGG